MPILPICTDIEISEPISQYRNRFRNIGPADEIEAYLLVERERLLDCLAGWLVANPERGRKLWSGWRDPEHRRYKGEEWIADMRGRIARLKAGTYVG